MKLLAKKVQRFLVEEDGPTTVEYAFMMMLIILVCIAAITTVGTRANIPFTTAGAALE